MQQLSSYRYFLGCAISILETTVRLLFIQKKKNSGIMPVLRFILDRRCSYFSLLFWR